MNRGEHRQALIDALSLEETSGSSNDPLFTDTILDRFINRAVKWVSNLHDWQQTQKAVKRDAEASQEFYNYPENFKTDSLYRLTVDGKVLKQVLFEEYENYKENNSGDKLLWADWKRRFFLNPIPSADGVKNIKLWGHQIPADMTADADENPFNDEQLLEEAIHARALALCYTKKGGSFRKEARELTTEALTYAETSFDRQLDKQSHYQTEEAEMFEHTDFLNEQGSRTKRGSFNTC
jgi:hypothetical protein